MATLYIVYVIDDKYPTLHRYRIIERVCTVDGVRDRITSVSYKTLEEARDRIKYLETHNG